MCLYVIGKLESNNKTIAYKIYDSDSKESKIIAKKDIINAMKNGIEIIGLYHRINSKGCSVLQLNTNIPNILKLSTVDSLGNKIDDASNHCVYILLGIKGFNEFRQFHVIDVNCQEYQLGINEIKSKSIIGLSQNDNNIFIHTKYRKQVY